MIQIDGSYGEGGGQILRTACALSILTNKPVEIKNIRAKRPTPGLKPQHHTAITCMKTLSNAETEGLRIDSSNLKFIPGNPKGGEYSFNIGTAGSITLIFQACILAMLKIKEPVIVRLKGGTDVKWSPSWDYFKYVFLPLINKMGITTEAELLKRGYYPKGGGEAIIKIKPTEEIQPLKIKPNQDFSNIEGIIHLGGLPDHIGQRMKHSAIKNLTKNNLTVSIKIEKAHTFSTGTGITLWTKAGNTILGSTNLGEKGITSEKVGETVALQLFKEINSESTLDIYAIDQLLPYFALVKEQGLSYFIRTLSNHAKTNMWLINKFIDKSFQTIEQQKNVKLVVK